MLWVVQARDVQRLRRGRGCESGSKRPSGACGRQPCVAGVDVSVCAAAVLSAPQCWLSNPCKPKLHSLFLPPFLCLYLFFVCVILSSSLSASVISLSFNNFARFFIVLFYSHLSLSFLPFHSPHPPAPLPPSTTLQVHSPDGQNLELGGNAPCSLKLERRACCGISA